MIRPHKLLPLFITALMGIATGYAIANSGEDHSRKHAGHNSSQHLGQHSETPAVATVPTEQGQSAFAAIAEIVSILENEPNTDWSKVDINALREHLVDMDALTLGTSVAAKNDGSSIIFTADGADGRDKSIRALQNMVPAHARELDKMDVWQVSGEKTEAGAVLIITPNDVSELTRIEALGFFGLMATGAHHQAHHLGMASGNMNH